jgi:hypothetical protein
MLEVIGSDGDVWDRIDAPILGTIRDCKTTDYGWHGIMPNGHAIEVRSAHPGVYADIPADGWLKVRSPDGQLSPFLKGIRRLYESTEYPLARRAKQTTE